MGAVCKVARTTQYRNTTGALECPERGAWGSVYYCDYSVFSDLARLREFVLMHAWIALLPHVHALHHPSP